MRAGCGRIPATSSSDARRAADLTSVEPQARYGADGLGARAARFLVRAGAVPARGCWVIGLGCPPGWGHLAPVSLAALRLSPGAGGAALGGPSSRRPPSSSAVLGLPVSGARRQVLCGPAQLRRADARLAPGRLLPPSTPRGMAALRPAPSSLSSCRSTEGHLWWFPGGSCPGPLGDPVAARPVRGARYLREPRRYWRGKGPGAGRMLPARGLKTSPNFGPVVEGEVVGLGF